MQRCTVCQRDVPVNRQHSERLTLQDSRPFWRYQELLWVSGNRVETLLGEWLHSLFEMCKIKSSLFSIIHGYILYVEIQEPVHETKSSQLLQRALRRPLAAKYKKTATFQQWKKVECMLAKLETVTVAQNQNIQSYSWYSSKILHIEKRKANIKSIL